ncbi:MAG: ArnT family glycosyltransferase [Armatimonadota bacterium]
MHDLVDILAILAFAFAAFTTGRACLRRLRVQPATAAEDLALGTGLGLGILAYAVLLLGLLGLLHVWAVLALLALYAAAGAREVPGAARDLLRSVRAWRPGPWGATIVAVAALAAAVAFVGVLAPPSSSEWDSLSYHLAAPKVYLKHHRIIYLPYDHHSNFPFTMEMLYTLGLMLSGHTLAKLFHYLTLVLSLVAIGAFARRLFPAQRLSGPLAMAILATVPLVNFEAGTAYLDVALGFYVLLSVHCLGAWRGDRAGGGRWLALGAVFLGLAMGIKMTALVLYLLLLVGVAWEALRPRMAGAGRQLLVFAALAAAVASPWYVKTWINTGNPVYPFFYSVFGGSDWGALQASNYRDAQIGDFGMPSEDGVTTRRDAIAFLLAPYNLVAHPNYYFDKHGAPTLVWPASVVGPLFLMLLPPLALLRRVPWIVWRVLLLSAGFAIAWFIMSQQSRYFIALFPLLAVCAGYSAARILATPWRSLRAVVATCLAACLGTLLVVDAFMARELMPVAFGNVSEEAFHTRHLGPSYQAFQYLNRYAPENAKVALYGEPRGYFLDIDYMWADMGHSTLIDYAGMRDPDELLRRYRELGVTHLMINCKYAPGLLEGTGQEGRLIKALWDRGDLQTWEWRDRAGRIAVLVAKLPSGGAAEVER